MSKNYRRIREQAYGPIPKDEQGRSYEIHHIDGNKNNNDLSNLMCVSIQEHFDIHYKQEDYLAAHIISQRLKLSEEQIKILTAQMAEKKKGIIPYNKGKTGIYSKETIKRISNSVKELYKKDPKKRNLSYACLKRGIDEAVKKNPNLYKKFKEKNSFYGKKHSEETKLLISNKLKNRIPWNKGKKFNSDVNIRNNKK
jgi:hypothetical protein